MGNRWTQNPVSNDPKTDKYRLGNTFCDLCITNTDHKKAKQNKFK